jgi:hypothetical protein
MVLDMKLANMSNPNKNSLVVLPESRLMSKMDVLSSMQWVEKRFIRKLLADGCFLFSVNKFGFLTYKAIKALKNAVKVKWNALAAQR